MFISYFKTAYRAIFRHKVFSGITILGLACGLTCTLSILLFVADELSYDNFHSQGDRVHRIRYKIADFDLARVPAIFNEHLVTFFPEVERSARLYSRAVSVKVPRQGNDQFDRYEEANVNFTDPDIFHIFDFDFLSGETDLTEPFNVVLNKEIARKYFGSEYSAVGRTILMEGRNSFKVAAVVEDFPANSHTHFDMLVPFQNMYDIEPDTLGKAIEANFKQNWMVSHSPTYVLMSEDATLADANNRFSDFVTEKIPEGQQKGQSFEFQPLSDIHLNDAVQAQAEPPGSRNFIFIFIIVGLLTLLIACINFVNLSTAKSLQRAKEIGMRKVLGSSKGHLVGQFLGESLITTLMAAIASVLLTILFLPQLNTLTNKELEITYLLEPAIFASFVLLVMLTSFLAGIYPAFFVTKISPIYSLKGITSGVSSGFSFRRVLIVVQFVISILLITSAFVVMDQLSLLRNQALGFSKEFVVTVPVQSANLNSAFGGVTAEKRQKMNAFESEIGRNTNVMSSTLSSIVPGFGAVNRNIVPEGFTAEDNMLSPVMAVDYDFLETYEIEVVSGRAFSKEYASDPADAFIINEKALESFNFGSPEEALGKSINLEGKKGKVVGVVGDFNFLPLSQAIQPLILHVNVPEFSVYSIRLANQSIPETLSMLEQTWNEFFPDETFDYSFLDESLADNYEGQEQFGTLISYFAILAIVISCLGSYGLIMFIVSRKRKELGVRKVLGASIPQIVYVLSYRFLILVIVAIVIATPLTILAANSWLEDFSYRTDISPWSIVLASLITIFLVLATISFQSVKAALTNPVKSLRTE